MVSSPNVPLLELCFSVCAQARLTRLRMADVALSRREARRQRREQERIQSMRQALREIANRKYRAYIEKVKLQREKRTGVKEWDDE